MNAANRSLIQLLAPGASGAASRLAGAPWWMTAMTVACGTVVIIVQALPQILQAALPQESADRVTWWRDSRRHQRRRWKTRGRARQRGRRPDSSRTSRRRTQA